MKIGQKRWIVFIRKSLFFLELSKFIITFVEIYKMATGKFVNSDYFEKIDSGRKAYLLGFLIADGSIISQKVNKQLNHIIRQISILYLKTVLKSYLGLLMILIN